MKAITRLSQLDLNKKYSYADYLTWKLNERVELIKGWIHKMSPAPNVTHQKVSWNISGLISKAFEDEKCKPFAAPFDVRLFKQNATDSKVMTVVQPDICIICDLSKLDERGCIGAPDFIIEIVSPGNSKKELKTKYELYEENGVKEYWVVNPMEKCVQQFYSHNKKFEYLGSFFDDEKINSRVFKNFKADLKKVFKD
jgi:Uma2 family endonuclease